MEARKSPATAHAARVVSSESETCGHPLDQLKAQLQESKQDLIEHERTIAHARNQIDMLNKSLLQHEAEVEASRHEIANLNSKIENWKTLFRGMVDSTSWKMTAPARHMLNVWRRLNQYRRLKLQKTGDEAKDRFAEIDPGSSLRRELPTEPSIHSEASMESRLAVADAVRHRRNILEQAFQELFASAGDTTGNGRYVHHVPDRIDTGFLEVKAIAFYSPHIPESHNSNDGFGKVSNWADVSKAIPRYLGHYQPHLPDALGYYDVRVHGVVRKQVELAKQYGISGFCFELRRVSETEILPLQQLLADPTLEISFCVAWGERVAGTQHEPGIAMNNSRTAEDRDVLLQFLAKAFADPRYIRIEGKPLLVISGHSDGVFGVGRFRDRATAMGLPGLYIAVLCPPHVSDQLGAEFDAIDAIIEDPTCGKPVEITAEIPLIDTHFKGKIYSYAEMLEAHTVPAESRHVILQNVVTGWDDEAGKPGEGRSFLGTSPTLYAKWLDRSCRLTMLHSPAERFLFISSWNNWSEGAHLEPDRRFGYAYLHVTANVLRRYHRDASTEMLVNDINAGFSPTSEVAIVLHCFYEDLIGPIFDRYLSRAKAADLIVTVRSDVSPKAIEEMRKRFPNIFFLPQENRGRDIRPFLFALQRIRTLGYRFACKVHTKKTPQVEDGGGELWRLKLMDQLLGSDDSSEYVVQRFNGEDNLGLLVPRVSVEDLGDLRNHIDNTFWLDRLLARMNRPDLIGNYALTFPAGSMYWFRVEALDGFESLALAEDAFEQELGQRDGTLAHALERLVGLYALQQGYHMQEIDVTQPR